MSCVSASGVALPPLMIYPRKKEVPEAMKIGSLSGTVFKTSKNGWITQEIYLDWFKYFIESIPPARPVLLIEDGHASHIGIDVIELARASDIHLLCLPAHTSHILQPLDIGVFRSFKANYSKMCRKYIVEHPGRVVTSDQIAALVAQAWPHSFTPLNIMSGFKKSGIFPFNPGEVSDRMLAPAKAVHKHQDDEAASAIVFSQEKVSLFQQRFDEGYNIFDREYVMWLKETHPDALPLDAGCFSATHLGSSDSTDGVSLKTHASVHSNPASSVCSDSLSDILVLPEPSGEASRRKRKPALNSKAICISDDEVLQELKDKEAQKLEAKHEQVKKRVERKERMRRRLEEKERKKRVGNGRKAEKVESKSNRPIEELLQDLDVSDDDVECPKCHLDTPGEWISCDHCEIWYHIDCTTVSSDSIPQTWFCENCV